MQGPGGGGLGAGGNCICVKCGASVPHRSGMPCMQERCPECGTAMVREGSPHHQKALERQRNHSSENE